MLADRVAERRSFRPQAAADPVSLEEFGALLGRDRGYTSRTKAGVSMSDRRALGLSAWYSGVLHISTVIAGLPFHRYRDDGDSRVKLPAKSWMKNPDREQTWFGLIEFVMMSLLHRGNSLDFKVRNAAGQVVGLREVHPNRATGGIGPDGTKRWVIDDDTDRLWTTRDILHIPGLSYDGRFGLNPIQFQADTLGGVVAANDYSHRFFGESTNMGGIISVEHAMTRDEAITLREQWDEFHRGIANAHKTGVLSKGAKYERVTLNAEDAQLIQSRNFGIDEVARILRLPPHKLYELSRSTNNNIEHQSIEAVQDCYQPWCERIEAWFNADPDLTEPGTYCEFTLEGRLRGDTTSRYAALTSAIGGPWMSVNEARSKENLPRIEGGDVVLAPLNMRGTADPMEGTAA